MKIKGSIKGFALLQMGILIILIGLIVVLAIPRLGYKVSKEKRVDTKEIIESDIDAIVGFAAVNDRLPTVDEFVCYVRTPKDIWGNDLVYRPDDNLDNSGSTICGRTTTDTIVKRCGSDDTCASPDEDRDVAFVIFSGGENLNLQTLVNVAGSSATIQTYIQGLPGIDDYTTGLSRPEEYKDIVRWMDLNELKIKIGCYGSSSNLRIINSSLPSGTVGTAYAVNVLAEGGVTMADGGDSGSAADYEWCVEGDLPSGLSYDCDGSLSVSTTCTLTSGTWNQCTYLEISGTPTAEGDTVLPIAVRDEDGDIAHKVFGLQVVPETQLNVCAAYRVWNGLGAMKSFEITGSGCITGVADGDEITTSPSVMLNATEDIRQYQQHNSCGKLKLTATYRQAILGDINEDCCVNFTNYAPPDYVIFVDMDCP
jgi:type II secretory pathway pseudopilin PulG